MRVYATRRSEGLRDEEDSQERVLVEIKCDWCPRTIKPGPGITNSGWKKGGFAEDFPARSSGTEWQACPDHAHKITEMCE